MPDVFAVAIAGGVKAPPGPVQYKPLRSPVADGEHGRLQLVAHAVNAEPYILQVKPGGPAGDPVEVMNVRNVILHDLRVESSALGAARDDILAGDATDGARLREIDDRIAAIAVEVKGQPKVSALTCAPVAKALMLYAAEDADDE